MNIKDIQKALSKSKTFKKCAWDSCYGTLRDYYNAYNDESIKFKEGRNVIEKHAGAAIAPSLAQRQTNYTKDAATEYVGYVLFCAAQTIAGSTISDPVKDAMHAIGFEFGNVGFYHIFTMSSDSQGLLLENNDGKHRITKYLPDFFNNRLAISEKYKFASSPIQAAVDIFMDQVPRGYSNEKILTWDSLGPEIQNVILDLKVQVSLAESDDERSRNLALSVPNRGIKMEEIDINRCEYGMTPIWRMLTKISEAIITYNGQTVKSKANVDSKMNIVFDDCNRKISLNPEEAKYFTTAYSHKKQTALFNLMVKPLLFSYMPKGKDDEELWKTGMKDPEIIKVFFERCATMSTTELYKMLNNYIHDVCDKCAALNIDGWKRTAVTNLFKKPIFASAITSIKDPTELQKKALRLLSLTLFESGYSSPYHKKITDTSRKVELVLDVLDIINGDSRGANLSNPDNLNAEVANFNNFMCNIKCLKGYDCSRFVEGVSTKEVF